MGKETEMEILVENLDAVKAQLDALGYICSARFNFRDVYFGKKSFYNNDRIRLRNQEMTYPRSETLTILTKKHPSSKDGIQKANEENAELNPKYFEGNYESLKMIHKDIVLDEDIKVERYELDEVIVDLREVEGLFYYVEIEAPTSEEVLQTKELLEIDGEVLEMGALNKVLELRGLPLIKMS